MNTVKIIKVMLRDQNPNTQLIEGKSHQLSHFLQDKTPLVSCSKHHVNRADKENFSHIIETSTFRVEKEEISVTQAYSKPR